MCKGVAIHESDVAVVTGGGSGLGAAACRALAAEGLRVVVADWDKEATERTVRSVGADHVAWPCDVTSEHDVRALCERVAALGTLRTAVLCAGIADGGLVLDDAGRPLARDVFRRVIEVNVLGALFCAQGLAAVMSRNPLREGERGVLVLTSSIAATEGKAGQVAYAASKAAVSGVTLPLARDLARHAVRVMTIEPGTMDTPLLASATPDFRSTLQRDLLFPPRFGDVDEFGQLVTAVLHNKYLNGSVIRLDGGMRLTQTCSYPTEDL